MRFAVPTVASALILSGCATSQADFTRGVVPIEQDRWMMRIAENYPSRALRMEEEGRVSLTVTVGNLGRVTQCRITRSSGSVILDQAACDGVTRYARFEPALGRDGDPVEGEWSTTVNYEIR